MGVIFKYDLTGSVTKIEMPKTARILCVQAQRDIPRIWAHLPDRDGELSVRTITIIGTGHDISEDSGKYIGTFQVHGGDFIFHVFEA